MKKPLLTRKACLIILVICVVLIAAFRVFFADTLADSELMRSLISDDDYRPAILNTLVMDALGSVVFVCMTIYMGYRVWGIKKPWLRSLLFGLPALAVAVNNAPIIGLATGNAYITDPAGGVLIMHSLLPGKSPLIRFWLGLSLGMLLLMQLPALCAHVLGFTLAAHGAAVVVLLAAVTGCYVLRDKAAPKRMTQEDRKQLAVMAAFVLPMTALSAYLQ